MLKPLYTPDNCEPAYQLDWSYTVFWHNTPSDFSWFRELKELSEKDHIRLLQHQFEQPNVSKFLISTRPHVAPLVIAQRTKGRLQHLIRGRTPDPVRRNYALRSIGSTKREKLDRYLETQFGHHSMADPEVQERLREYQIHRTDVDLSAPRYTSHGMYWYNLHVVMVNEYRWRHLRDAVLQKAHDMIGMASREKGHLLSRAAVLPDHVHLTLGCRLEESPQQVVLSYMNNLAYVCEMKSVLKFSYYVGTFSEYDLGVIPRP